MLRERAEGREGGRERVRERERGRLYIQKLILALFYTFVESFYVFMMS